MDHSDEAQSAAPGRFSFKKYVARVGVLIVVGALLSVAFFAPPPEDFVSSEFQFTSTLSNGLAAVPASCPSSPHTAGECDAPPLNGAACVLVATPSAISSGGSVIIGWNSSASLTQDPRTITPTIGTVAKSGSITISPTVTTTYTFTSAPKDGTGSSNVVCTTTVTVNGSGGSCSPVYFCSGNDLMYRSNQCVDSLITTCPNGCLDGACIGASSLDGQLVANPRLIRSGDTTTLTWSVSGASSCTVTGDNGDSWTGTSGPQTSSALQSQTVYTLSCSGEGGTLTDTETVNIIPIFEET